MVWQLRISAQRLRGACAHSFFFSLYSTDAAVECGSLVFVKDHLFPRAKTDKCGVQVIVVNYEDKLTTMEAPDDQDEVSYKCVCACSVEGHKTLY